jgi:hypothetical protein
MFTAVLLICTIEATTVPVSCYITMSQDFFASKTDCEASVSMIKKSGAFREVDANKLVWDVAKHTCIDWGYSEL